MHLHFYHKKIFSRRILIAYKIGKCLVGMKLYPQLYVLRISIVMKKSTIEWMSLLVTSSMNKQIIALMMVGKEKRKNLPLIPWMKEGMKKRNKE
jgi:hypothetical protein